MARPPRTVVHLLQGAGAPLMPVPPRSSRLLLAVLRPIAPLYRRLVMGVSQVTVVRRHDLQAHLTRENTLTFVAFRHPSADDPQLVFQVVRGAGGTPPVFLYGRGVPIWGGPLVAWILPRVGAISVYHGGINRGSMDMVRTQICGNPAPVCLAPEAQVTYHNYRVAAIQRGTAALALDAAECGADGREVQVLPLGIEFRYPDRNNRRLVRYLNRLERMTASDGPAPARDDLVGRLWHQFRVLLSIVLDSAREDAHEQARQGVGGAARTIGATAGTTGTDDGPTTPLEREVSALFPAALEHALRTAERRFGLSRGSGDAVSRIFRIRHRFWERAFPDPPPAHRLGSALADIEAVESRIAARWLETADLLAYLDGSYLSEVGLRPGAHVPEAGSARHARLVEYLIAALDLAGRMQGHTIGRRVEWPGRRCRMEPGSPRMVRAGGARRRRSAELTDWIYSEFQRLSSSDSSDGVSISR